MVTSFSQYPNFFRFHLTSEFCVFGWRKWRLRGSKLILRKDETRRIVKTIILKSLSSCQVIKALSSKIKLCFECAWPKKYADFQQMSFAFQNGKTLKCTYSSLEKIATFRFYVLRYFVGESQVAGRVVKQSFVTFQSIIDFAKTRVVKLLFAHF